MKPALVSRKTMVIAALMALIISCNVNSKNGNALFNTGNIPLDEYTIDVTRDTVLHTKRGAIINIPANSIEAKQQQITLQIREAFNIADIIAAGLTTESNGAPLSSGGMIYINAAEQNGAKVVKPIGVSIPADYLQEGMELYKGEQKDDGSINWVDPASLAKNTMMDRIGKGEAIFRTNCSDCHNLHTSATGPALAGITQLRTKHFLNRFIRSSTLMIAGNGTTQEEYAEDHLAACLYDRWNRTAMSLFPNLTDDDLNILYEYLENEGNKIGISEKIRKCNDSCKLYVSLREGLSTKKWGLIAENDPRIELKYYDGDSQLIIPRSIIPPPEDKVMPSYNSAVYYEFKIDAFGWYNIDMLLNKDNDFVNSRLTVNVEGTDPDVFLVIPERKIFQRGGYMEGDDGKFAFDKINGTVPLPQGIKAYIIAVSESDGKIFFGIQGFVTATQQDINVRMTAISKEELDDKIKSLDMAGVNMRVQKTKNADSILVIDQQLKNLELLRPKDCDCGCEFDEYLSESDTARVR